MLAKLDSEIPAGDGWVYEPKWDGFRALIYAAEGSKDAVDVVSLLVAAGADVNARDTTGTTPLRAAKNWRHPQAYASLQAAGAPDDLVNDERAEGHEAHVRNG